MKPLLFILSLSLLCAGCGKKPSSSLDARVAKLEADNKLLQDQMLDLDKNVVDMSTNWQTFLTNSRANSDETAALLAGFRKTLTQQAARFDAMTNVLGNMSKSKTTTPATYTPPQHTMPTVGKVTMPTEVYNQIKAFAEREYPNDFSLQMFEIKRQTKAWYELQGAPLPDNP